MNNVLVNIYKECWAFPFIAICFLVVDLIFVGMIIHALRKTSGNVYLPSDALIGIIFFYVLGGLWLASLVMGEHVKSPDDFITQLVGAHFFVYAVLATIGFVSGHLHLGHSTIPS